MQSLDDFVDSTINTVVADCTLDELINALCKLEQSTDKEDTKRLISQIQEHACDDLIFHNGVCNYPAIQRVMAAGFNVFPGEADRFGWLTGCIETNKGIIVFG